MSEALIELAQAIHNFNHSREDYARDGGEQGWTYHIEMPLVHIGRAYLKAAGLPYGQMEGEELLAFQSRESAIESPVIKSRRRREAVPQWLRWKVFERDNFTCLHCGSRSVLEADHIIPWSAGGATSFDNLQTLCHDCNARKGATVGAS